MHVKRSLDSVNITEFFDSCCTICLMVFNYAGAVIPGILLLGASYAGTNEALIVFLFSLGMGFMGLWYPGMKVNPLDLSPNYAATVMAISNAIGSAAGFAAPIIVSQLTQNVSNT